MNPKKLMIRLVPAVLMALSTATSYGAGPTVRNITSDFDNASAIPPESFETDVHKLRQNWYLRNYTILDDKADVRSSVTATDQEYIDRLQRMNTVIEMPYNKLVRSFINMYVERKKGLVESMLGMSLYYMPIFEEALERHKLPLELKYLPVIESALNPNAVSRAGAAGLWQFIPSAGTGEGLEINSVVDERRDPYRSSEAAAKLLKKLYGIYGDWSLAIAAYNCGPGNVNKAIKRAGGGKKDFWEIYRFLPAETRDYLPAFIAANYAMTNFRHHNISPALASKPIVTDSVHVRRRVHFQQISDVLDIPMDELRVLNPQYRTDVIPGDVRPYPLVLPNLQVYAYIANEDSIVNHEAEKYARREIVEPVTAAMAATPAVNSQGQKGEYVQQLVVKYHKVRRGESLTSIARRYGVSESSIRKANGVGRRVKQGTTLRINTYTSKFIPSVEAPADSTAVSTPANPDSIAVTTTPPPVAEPAPVEEAPARVQQPAQPQRRKAEPAKPVSHVVKGGENLTKIAAKYGVTVDQLRAANNIKGDNIQAGQSLNIPTKAQSNRGTSRKKSGTRKRRRR